MENIDRMNLANEIDLTGQLKPGTPKNYYAPCSTERLRKSRARNPR